MRGFPMADGSIIELVVGHVRTPCGRVDAAAVSRRVAARLLPARRRRSRYGEPPVVQDRRRSHRVRWRRHLPRRSRCRTRRRHRLWLARAAEDDLLLKWTGGWVTANAASLTTARCAGRRARRCRRLRRRTSARSRRRTASRFRPTAPTRRDAAARARAHGRRNEVGRRGLLSPRRSHEQRGGSCARRLRPRAVDSRHAMSVPATRRAPA